MVGFGAVEVRTGAAAAKVNSFSTAFAIAGIRSLLRSRILVALGLRKVLYLFGIRRGK